MTYVLYSLLRWRGNPTIDYSCGYVHTNPQMRPSVTSFPVRSGLIHSCQVTHHLHICIVV